MVFAIVTQLQFSRISDEKIYQARLDTYYSDVYAYDTAIQAKETCIANIEIRDTYRGIFTGISDLFVQVADLPVELFPESEIAKTYQVTLTTGIFNLIVKPLEDNLPPKDPKDCPAIPEEAPVRPNR